MDFEKEALDEEFVLSGKDVEILTLFRMLSAEDQEAILTWIAELPFEQ
ncbi:MAG: hypothetical protein ILA17_05975 [Ruminococcus sp.]|nr:hypothetical protein [Ruminococcus sp.]